MTSMLPAFVLAAVVPTTGRSNAISHRQCVARTSFIPCSHSTKRQGLDRTRDLHPAIIISCTPKQQSSPDPVLEGDLICYRPSDGSEWTLGAVVDTAGHDRYEVRPVHSRVDEQDGCVECFVDWDADMPSRWISSDAFELVLLDFDYEQRVIQDRVENPHGEESEDCWRVSTDTLHGFRVSIPQKFIA